jgi:hypothetical protein
MDERQRSWLLGLAEKYEALRRLRAQVGAQEAVAARVQMAALAARFPGALRELDALPEPLIGERLREIEAALAQSAPPARWMILQASYHGHMRVALRLRRLLRAGGVAVTQAVRAYQPSADEPPAAWLDAPTLRAIDRPPSGRLVPWVFAEVAKRHGVSADDVRRALFPR